MCGQVSAQENYWQQYLHYNIDAQLNDQEKSITGKETIVYKNNSPDTLSFIWFHIYANAYKDESTALFQQIKKDPGKKHKIKHYSPGFMSGLAFSVNGITAATEPDPNPEYIDIIKVLLPQPLLPGDSITIGSSFKVQLPSYFSRSGFEDGEFMACQWYPKPAVFDKNGWHEMPYLDMGEFYSEYASYHVNITLPAAYVGGATGILQTTAEANAYKTTGSYNTAHREDQQQLYKPLSADSFKTLTYYADSVVDFAWFADKEFIVEYDTMQLSSGRVIDAFTYYHNSKKTPWANSIDDVKDAVRHYSAWIGEFDYPVVQAVEGPKNNSADGMEYPTITLITSPGADGERLDDVITHEVGHNWFMAMLGTNERDHAWMDEGLNTYFEFRYMAEKYRGNPVFGNKIPYEVTQLSEQDFQQAVYLQLSNLPIHEAIETKSADFDNEDEYALAEYIKPAIWMYMIEKTVGLQNVDNAFHTYFNLWKFKHPQPEDLKEAFESALSLGFNDYFNLLKKEDSLQ